MNKFLFHGDLITDKRIVYTPSQFAKANLIYLQEIGSLTATSPHTSSRSNLSSFLFFIVKSGSGELAYEGKKHKLTAGDCVFIDCEPLYAHQTSDKLWNLVWVHFNGQQMRGIYDKYKDRGGGCVFHPESIEQFSECLIKLYDSASSDNYLRDMYINEALAKLLSLIMQESWHPENRKKIGKAEIAVLVRKYLDEHYAEKITLEDLSKKFYVNKYYLTRIFRIRYDITIIGYLSKLRIDRAKQLLRFTGLSISEIGNLVGIADSNYLSRLFIRIEGLSPSAYREAWEGKQASKN